MSTLKDKKRGGFYFIDTKPFVSVTEVLKIIDKPALRYWTGQGVYRAMVANPTLSEQEALSAPYKTAKKSADRGSTVHSIIEAYRVSGAKLDNIPPEFQGYADAFYKWVHDINPNFVETERTVFSKTHKYAGTLDLLAKIGGRLHLIDFKTNKDGNLYDEVELQLSAYYNALQEEGVPVEEMAAVGLSENGNYTLKTCENQFDKFLSCKSLWEWKNKELCKKIGYTI